MRVTERDLILPALRVLHDTNGELSTTAMSRRLRSIVKPQGEDLEILAGRNDDKFSQKVRNLRSHKTLETPGYATHESRGRQGYWQITPLGRQVVDENETFAELVLDSGFDASAIAYALSRVHFETAPPQQKTLVFDENALITEGARSQAARSLYQRSRTLRDRAIQVRQAQGQLRCEACGFDFEEAYGEIGRGFIEIHHKIPIFCLEGESVERTVEEAMENVASLCANCHRMIHRRREEMMSLDALQLLIMGITNNA
jgi:predicted HNH restriction endonuclease